MSFGGHRKCLELDSVRLCQCSGPPFHGGMTSRLRADPQLLTTEIVFSQTAITQSNNVDPFARFGILALVWTSKPKKE